PRLRNPISPSAVSRSVSARPERRQALRSITWEQVLPAPQRPTSIYLRTTQSRLRTASSAPFQLHLWLRAVRTEKAFPSRGYRPLGRQGLIRLVLLRTPQFRAS